MCATEVTSCVRRRLDWLLGITTGMVRDSVLDQDTLELGLCFATRFTAEDAEPDQSRRRCTLVAYSRRSSSASPSASRGVARRSGHRSVAGSRQSRTAQMAGLRIADQIRAN